MTDADILKLCDDAENGSLGGFPMGPLIDAARDSVRLRAMIEGVYRHNGELIGMLSSANEKVRVLREALESTSELIAANRLVLGEYAIPRYVAEADKLARDGLAATAGEEKAT